MSNLLFQKDGREREGGRGGGGWGCVGWGWGVQQYAFLREQVLKMFSCAYVSSPASCHLAVVGEGGGGGGWGWGGLCVSMTLRAIPVGA